MASGAAHRAVVAICIGHLAALALDAQSVVRLGIEFQVNTYTTYGQSYPAVGVESDGDFVVVWTSADQDGSNAGLFGQRFDSTGSARGVEFQVNTYTDFDQIEPALASDAGGDFVVSWTSNLQDGSFHGIFARRFASSGAALAVEFQVNLLTLNGQRHSRVAMDTDGDFVIAWQSSGQDGGGDGVFARRYDSAGSALGGELQVNTYTSSPQQQPAIAMNAGAFVIAWSSDQDGSGSGVFARRFASTGTALAAEFQLNTYTNHSQYEPVVAMRPDGDFVVAWASYGQDGQIDSAGGVFAQRFASTGSPVAVEFQVNTYTGYGQKHPAIAINGAGDFVIAWQSYALTEDVLAQRYDSAGAAIGGEFQVNTRTSDQQVGASIDFDGDGRFVVAWYGYSQDGSQGGVFAQRFGLGAALDVDGNGTIGALTDGLLVLRYLFGFTGATLTSGATGAGCSRCDGASIASYLGGLGLALDIDGNGSKGALTDGLLVLRFLFGFTGATLTAGAVDTNACTRCDGAAILVYLTTMK